MTHGINIVEQETRIKAPVYSDAACQIVVGIAPINLISDPTSAVNKPILVNNFEEAVQKVGYCTDFENYGICQSIYMSFRNQNVAPLVFINVIDPDNANHVTTVAESEKTVTTGKVQLTDDGILLNTLTVKNDTTPLVVDEDFVASFDDNGKVVIQLVGESAELETVKVGYTKLNPTGVTASDIVGGYSAATGKYKGIEAVKQVFPVLGKVGGILTAPNFSQNPIVMGALKAMSHSINGVFKCINICDVDTNACDEYTECVQWKNNNSYTDKFTYLGWPKVKIGDYIFCASAQASALMAQTIADEKSQVPYISPSNHDAGITGCCLADGTEVFLDIEQANVLNDNGIFTYINWQGWKLWGNRMACYPANSDPKDCFVTSRNMFNWWANTFILTYFSEIDKPMNRRNIDRIIDTENIRANGFIANEQIAGAKMTFLESDNPQTSLIAGKVTFHQTLTPFPPMEDITNVLEYDVDELSQALFGGN